MRERIDHLRGQFLFSIVPLFVWYWPPRGAGVFLLHITDDWVTSNWSQFETVNSLRQLRRINPKLPPELPEGLRRLFKKWPERGNFSLERTDGEEAIDEAARISAAFGTSFRARSADVLHFALLEQINPDCL
ncbi:MAG TPA: hypothetical protein VGR78_05830 [Verrucomicrobiae bacterium]|nr:hypothetical protein [Verrucomicrobiae bacterium]